MNTNYDDNNHLTLVGKVTSEKRFTHEIYGEKFYIFDLSVPRLSGNADNIPVTISERLLTSKDIVVGSNIEIDGQFRSYNGYENEKSKLILTVFAKEIKFFITKRAPECFLNSIVVFTNLFSQTGRNSLIASAVLSVEPSSIIISSMFL